MAPRKPWDPETTQQGDESATGSEDLWDEAEFD